MMKIKTVLLVAVVVSVTGCASVMNETTHGLKIDTQTQSGEAIVGAECKLSNDYGTTTATSGESSLIRRSNKDMDVRCKHPGQEDAVGRLISRSNMGLAGNLIFGGGIGAIIDHNKGTAYTYPTWIKMIFGETLVFDRSDEQEGQPLEGRSPNSTNPANDTQPSETEKKDSKSENTSDEASAIVNDRS